MLEMSASKNTGTNVWENCKELFDFPQNFPPPTKCVMEDSEEIVFTVQWKNISCIIQSSVDSLTVYNNLLQINEFDSYYDITNGVEYLVKLKNDLGKYF